MCIINKVSRAKVYKFLKANVFGRLFFFRKFRGKGLIYANINRRFTSKKIRLNALKLRRKKPTLRGLGIFATLRLKKFYFGLSHFQLKQTIKMARKLPFYKIKNFKNDSVVRVADKLVSLLEFRLDNVLQRSGLFSSQCAHFLLAHRKVQLNGRVVTKSSIVVSPGDIITFDTKALPLVRRGLIKQLALKFRFARRLRNLRGVSAPIVQPFMILNKLVYLSLSCKTLRIIVGNTPKFLKKVYYPFNADVKHLILNFNNI
jgi:ribosomal protein S4